MNQSLHSQTRSSADLKICMDFLWVSTGSCGFVRLIPPFRRQEIRGELMYHGGQRFRKTCAQK